MAVESTNTHAGTAGDLVQADVRSIVAEGRLRHFQQSLAIALCVGALLANGLRPRQFDGFLRVRIFGFLIHDETLLIYGGLLRI
jgi:hypothetical protein